MELLHGQDLQLLEVPDADARHPVVRADHREPAQPLGLLRKPLAQQPTRGLEANVADRAGALQELLQQQRQQASDACSQRVADANDAVVRALFLVQEQVLKDAAVAEAVVRVLRTEKDRAVHEQVLLAVEGGHHAAARLRPAEGVEEHRLGAGVRDAVLDVCSPPDRHYDLPLLVVDEDSDRRRRLGAEVLPRGPDELRLRRAPAPRAALDGPAQGVLVEGRGEVVLCDPLGRAAVVAADAAAHAPQEVPARVAGVPLNAGATVTASFAEAAQRREVGPGLDAILDEGHAELLTVDPAGVRH
mmetsp:Transcript_2002/g.6692  ORF Transcript_2002/g.6692 Transcript_2002/m.6692 type:complete len:302 (-) Transcript_2002:1015-1920(-)